MTQEKKSPDQDNEPMIDMYQAKSRWTVVLFIAFTVAFLIFALTLFFFPQSV